MKNTWTKYNKERAEKYFKEVEGKRFGKLIVLNRVEDIKKRRLGYVICQCDCGNKTELPISSLKRKKATVSCGCYVRTRRIIDITGQKFGRLTAISFNGIYVIGRKNKHDHYWLFRCDCGNLVIKNKNSVKNGNTLSCGCLRKEIAQKQMKKISPNLGKTPLRYLIRTATIYKEWRNEIFQRDNYICQQCGQQGGKLTVDHKKPFALILEENKIDTLEKAMNCFELWLIENGRTLCENCQRKTDTYGQKTTNLLKEMGYRI